MIRVQFLKFLLVVFCFSQAAFSQNPSALYQDWLDAQSNGSTSILPTFSYAGYKHGEEGVPFSFLNKFMTLPKVHSMLLQTMEFLTNKQSWQP